MLTRRTLVAFVASALFAAALGAQAVRSATPTETIASLQRGLIAVAREQPNAALEERYRALEPLIVATHDLPYIAEFALRRQWSSLSERIDSDTSRRFSA